MKIHCLQHGPDEGLGQIEPWIRERGHALTFSHLYRGDPLPDLAAVDWLILMGGAMNIYQYRDHPWLPAEKRFIARALELGKAALGICLGAQLLADVLGAKVYQNSEMEIGWFPVCLSDEALAHPLFEKFPRELTAMHWHGDTFDLPAGAVHLAQSDGCRHQAFAVGNNIVGLQFHLEVRLEDVAVFLDGPFPTDTGPFVQTRGEILACEPQLQKTHPALEALLDRMAAIQERISR